MIFDVLIKQRINSLITRFKPQIDYLEIRLEAREGQSIALNESGIRQIRSSHETGGCVRVIHKGGTGFASFSDLSLMESMAEEAIRMAKALAQEETCLAPVPVVVQKSPLVLTKDPRMVPLAEKIDLLMGIREQILRFNPEILKALGVQYAQSFWKKSYWTTEGTQIDQEGMLLDLMMRVTAFLGAEKTNMFEVLGSTCDFDFLRNRQPLVDTMCANAVRFVKAKTPDPKSYTVILDPRLAGVFVHESFGHTSEADLFASKPGGLETLKLGKRFGGDDLNLFDTGRIRGHAGDWAYDDEGVETTHTPLIEKGILVGRLHSRETAARLKEAPTGSARAINYNFSPIVRMRNTCIAPGQASFEELLSGVKDGIYAIGCYGGTGGEEFSFAASHGYKIENGQLTEPIKNMSISGNLFRTLADIDGIGRREDLQILSGTCGKHAQFPLSVSMQAPHIRIHNLNVG